MENKIKYCGKCGTFLGEGNGVCPGCGFVYGEQSDNGEYVPPFIDTTALRQPVNLDELASEDMEIKVKKKRKLFITGISLVLVLAIVTSVLLIFKNKELEKQLADRNMLAEILAKHTDKPLADFYCDDYDGNGTYEGFAVVGNTKSGDYETVHYDDADLWYIDYNNAVMIQKNMSGSANGTLVYERKKYVSFENKTEDSKDAYSYIYTVENEQLAEADISGKYQNVHKENNKLVGKKDGVTYDDIRIDSTKYIDGIEREEVSMPETVTGQISTTFAATTEKTSQSTVKTNLTATDKDFEMLEEMLYECCFSLVEDFDVSKVSTQDILEGCITGGPVPNGTYTYFYGSTVVCDEDNYPDRLTETQESDPEGRLYGAYKCEADKVDWIVKNVFEKSVDRSDVSDQYYYHGDYFYISGGGGGRLDVVYDIEKAYRLSDGTYGVVVSSFIDFLDGETGDNSTEYYVCRLKEDENIGRYWAILKGAREKACFEIPEEESLDSVDFYDAYVGAIKDATKRAKKDCNVSEIYGDYQMYDVNKDGVKEIFVKLGTCEANYKFYVYTVESNGFVYCGNLSGWHSHLDTNGKIICMFMGVRADYSLVLNDGKISSVLLQEYDLNDEGYSFSENYIESSDISSYDLISKEIK